MSNSSGEGLVCTCHHRMILRALASSPRADDVFLARSLAAEIESRHRRLGVARLTTSLPICSGYWLFATSEFSLALARSGLAVECAYVANPIQPIVADFVTETQYALVDDARSLAGKDFRILISVSNFYSALLNMFGPVIATCRGSAEIANQVVYEARAAARRVMCGRTGEIEVLRVAALLQSLLREEACLAA